MPNFMFANKKSKDKIETANTRLPWKILIVDDDESIHTVTELVLDDFKFQERGLNILNAYSAKESESVLKEHQDIAMIFLDVVMESDTAGLDLVHYIRNDLKNNDIRIVLRTGQPGVAPESEVVTAYDIDDYKDKTELTNIKLKTTVHNALKAYALIMQLKDNASNLEKYKNMFNSATDFIFVVNEEHKIIEANKAFLEAIGKAHDEVINKSIFEIFSDTHHKDMKKNILASILGQNISYESEMSFDKLGKRFVDVEFFPYYDKGHNLSAAVVNFKDITNDVIQREEMSVLKNKQIDNYEQTIISLVDTIEQRDSFTAGHTLRVAEYCKLIAIQMGVNAQDIEKLYKAAMLHDIGKISTPDAILLKPAKFNAVEYDLIKSHLDVGYELLKKVDMYKELAEIMVYHHERYDGKGYPHGLKADEIPLLGHIMGLSDAFDAMTTNRIYKKRKSVAVAIDEMISLKTQQFHPDVVDAAVIALKDVDVSDVDQLPVSSMERARFAYFFKDALTKTYNKDYLKIELSINKDKYNYISYLELHKMSDYNNNFGWEKGDQLLFNIAKYIYDNQPLVSIFRVHGDDFIMLTNKECEMDIDKINYQPFLADISTYLSVKSLPLKELPDINAENFEKFFK